MLPTDTFTQSLPHSLSPSNSDFQEELPPKRSQHQALWSSCAALDSLTHLTPTTYHVGFLEFVLPLPWNHQVFYLQQWLGWLPKPWHICPLLLLAFSSLCSCSAALFKRQPGCCAHAECLWLQWGIGSCSGLVTICNLPVTEAVPCSVFILCLAPGGLNPHWMLFCARNNSGRKEIAAQRWGRGTAGDIFSQGVVQK